MARTYTHVFIDLFKIRKMLIGLIGLCLLADTFYFMWLSHMPKMATELLVVTTDTEYWHAGYYEEEICAKPQFLKFIFECSALFTSMVAKPINSREQLFVIALKNIANMAKKVNRSLGDIELFDLSIEVKYDVQSCKDNLGMIVHLLVDTVASLRANFSVAGGDLGMIGKSLVNCELLQSNCMNELVRSDPKLYIRRDEIKLLKEHRDLFIQGQTI